MKKRLIIIIAIIMVVLAIIIIKTKTKIAQVEYQIADIQTYKYIKYKENDKFGIIDRDGNIIVNAEYDTIDIPNPEKDVFICYNGEDSKVLNSNNEKLFEKYNKVEPIKLKNIASTLCFEKTVLKYEKDGLYGLISIDGKKITSNIYKSIENLASTEGKFMVSKGEKYGVININGKMLVDTKYDRISTDNYYNEETKYVEAGFIVSNTTDNGYRYGYVGYNGQNYLNVEYNDIARITAKKEIYLIAAKNGQYGLYKEGKQLIKPEYQSIDYLDNGGLIIEKNSQYGIATLKGEIKVEPNYSQIEENGIYLYAQNLSQNDVYDIGGNKIDVNFNKYIYESENKNYRITTLLNNEITYYGIESTSGEALVKPSYAYIEYIFGDYFIAENEKEKYGVIKSNGDIIIDFDYDLIQKIKNKKFLQAIDTKKEITEIYSSNLERTIEMKKASIKNERNYVIIKNENETLYIDKDGNKIDEKAEIIQKDLQRDLPNEINGYSRKQYSLNDVYYEK